MLFITFVQVVHRDLGIDQRKPSSGVNYRNTILINSLLEGPGRCGNMSHLALMGGGGRSKKRFLGNYQ